MKQINLTMDGNGHIHASTVAGVLGDHNAAAITITLTDSPEQVTYYRLLFAGEKGSKITQQLFLQDETLHYVLPREVTQLGRTVLCQICGYAGNEQSPSILYKSDSFPLVFASSLPDTADLAESQLVDELNQMLIRVEAISQNFDLRIGKVESLEFGANATASVKAEADGSFTLNLGLPRGEKGEGNFTAGEHIVIKNGVISADSCPTVYEALESPYEYIGIGESKTVAQLSGRIFWVNPRYKNKYNQAFLYTNGEGVFQPVHRMKNGVLSSNIPAGSVVPGRIMAIYVNEDGVPVYLNPYETPANPLPVYTVTPESSAVLPALSFSFSDYEQFVGGKTILAIATKDINFFGGSLYGPSFTQITISNGTDWVNCNSLAGKTIKAGQPVWFYLEYDNTNHAFLAVRLLNPPV